MMSAEVNKKEAQMLFTCLPDHVVGFIGSFVDIFDLFSLMKTSKTMNLFFKNQNNHSTMKCCIRNVFDNEWLQLSLVVNSNNMNRAIQWLYEETLIYRQCSEYKVCFNSLHINSFICLIVRTRQQWMLATNLIITQLVAIHKEKLLVAW